MNQKITVIIITLNEEEHIQACIESAWQVADEIIVVDSLSTDKTREIAKNLGAQVIEQSYLGDGLQKAFGVQFAKNDWILSLDADERLDEQMIKEIQGINYTETTYAAYAFRRKNYIGTRWQKIWYPDYINRLYHKGRCRYSPRTVHAPVITNNYLRMEGNIIHFSFKDWSDYLVRNAEYSRRSAKILVESNRKVSAWDPVIHGTASFLKHYVLKKGFIYGLDGLNASLFEAVGSYLKYAQVIEIRENNALVQPDR